MAQSSPLSVQNLFNVNGMVIVVTGGGSGLGSYAARAFDANGAKAVYIVGRRGDSLNEVAKLAVNGNIKPLVGDISSKDSLAAIAETVRKEQGYINLLYANAGVTGPRLSALYPDGKKPDNVKDLAAALWKPSMEEFSSAQHLNCTATFYTALAFIELLDAGNAKGNVAQRSQILVTSSIAGFPRGIAAGFAYSTSKAATNHLVKTMSTYFADYKIRCNLIAPGLYPSEMTGARMSELENHVGPFQGAKAMPKSACPEERTGSEQDFAGTVLFMASLAGAYLNGETLVTDGGRLAQMPSTY